MKALIFNSGYGRRMGQFTKNNHKSMAVLANGETIFERQLRILWECGVRDFIITTGSFSEQIETICQREVYKDFSFTFVENKDYSSTNYIYSMYLAKDYLEGDFLVLHGDLVFNKKLVKAVLTDPRKNLGLVNKMKALPDKDFKARLDKDIIKEVSVSIFDKNCYAFQALYKLEEETLRLWIHKVEEYISKGNDQVYAENALNEIMEEININAFYYDKDYADEIDTLDDLARVSKEIRQFDFDEQPVFIGDEHFAEIANFFEFYNIKKPMLVCGSSFEKLYINKHIKSLKYEYIIFNEFSPNPKYEEVERGVTLFKKENCDGILAVGGGSAIDTAKNIKLFSVLNTEKIYLNQSYKYSPIKMLAIPTTAGSGSEATRFSVLYYKEEKQSIAHDCIVPDGVLLFPQLLKTLPLYQKKCTMMDALCQCIEAIWSVNSNELCCGYAAKGAKLILKNYKSYIMGEDYANEQIMLGAYFSGKAINISQTTAAHAMSYKLSSIYDIPHGHAVALCLSVVWDYMYEAVKDSDNQIGLLHKFKTIAEIFNQNEVAGAIDYFNNMLRELELFIPFTCNNKMLECIVKSVNPTRLANNPIALNEETIRDLYSTLLGHKSGT